jgi:hypothetical protein
MWANPSYIDPLRQPTCGLNRQHGREPASCSMQSACCVRTAASSDGVLIRSARVSELRATACPSSNIRRTIGGDFRQVRVNQEEGGVRATVSQHVQQCRRRVRIRRSS